MKADNDCPICGFQGISPDSPKCPQCDADLSCFRVLDSLPDALVSEKTVPKNRIFLTRAGITLLLCVFLTGVLAWIFRDRQSESPALYGQIYPVSVKIDMEAELARLASQRTVEPEPEISIPAGTPVDGAGKMEDRKETKSDPPAVEKRTQGVEGPQEKTGPEKVFEPEDRFWNYRPAGDETLWRIAQRHYGNGRYYPVLLKHNPGIEIYDLPKDFELRILRDPRQAEQVYKEITTPDGTRVSYLHVVEEGDTLTSIARRFYGKEATVERILRLNPEVKIMPGEVLKIELE